MINFKSSGIFIAIMGLLLAYISFYTVSEGQNGLVLHLGQLVTYKQTGKPAVMTPGLHFKWPVIEQVKLFDTRLQTFNSPVMRVTTADKKDILLNYYAKWQINNLPLFYTRTDGNEDQTNALLQQELNDNIRTQFATRSINQAITDSNSTVAATLLQKIAAAAQNLGIKIVDVRFKKIDLPPDLANAVFDRMRTDRTRIAIQLRANGKAQAEAIRANADANVKIALAKATTQAATIRAQGDAEAAKLYAAAYNQDPAFYAFYRSILAYQNAFTNKNDIIVLKPDNQFFKYFNNPNSNNSPSK